MKKLILFLIIMTAHECAWSYTWISFCPDTINATNICFGVGSNKGVICTNNGMYLHDDFNQVWNYYNHLGFPVQEAVPLNQEQILVVMGDGSWSDGIYSFDLQTHQFSVIHYCAFPNFLKYDELSGAYYAGCQFGGLLKSTDGLIWTEVPYFAGKSCTCMDFYANHYVISEVSNIYNIYWSDDSGDTWNQAIGMVPMITDMKFNNEGVLYGIFPGYSDSSGLWWSDDYGASWDVEFYSENMSAVGFDAITNIFTGWESPAAGNEGIALYDPLSPPPGLTFLNEGLPNTNINKIKLNPVMSAILIFCCTDGGIYYCSDYPMNIEAYHSNTDIITIYPNPFGNHINIHFTQPQDKADDVSVTIFNSHGIKVHETGILTNCDENILIRNLEKTLPGIYYCRIQINGQEHVKKLVRY